MAIVALNNNGTITETVAPASPQKLTAKNLHEYLKRRYSNDREWVYLTEVGFPNGTRIDGFVFNCFFSKGYKRIAFELKVSKSDFLHEVKNPDKRKAAVEHSHEFYFVTPKGMLNKNDIPPDCGLIEVGLDGSGRIKVRAPKKAAPPKLTSGFLSVLLRNAIGWRDNKKDAGRRHVEGIRRILCRSI
jgi:hypothetical protein